MYSLYLKYVIKARKKNEAKNLYGTLGGRVRLATCPVFLNSVKNRLDFKVKLSLEDSTLKSSQNLVK